MSDKTLEPETIAGILDGTLGEKERAQALAEIAKGGQAYRDFIETAAVHRDLLASGVSEGVVAERDAAVSDRRYVATFRRRQFYALTSLAAAAAILVFIVGRTFGEKSAATFARNSLQRSYASLDFRDVATGSLTSTASWTGWGAMRGATAVVSQQALAFRLGALFADLDVALMAHDSGGVRAIATVLERLSTAAVTSVPVAVRLSALAARGRLSNESERDAIVAELRSASARVEYFDLGILIETARLIGRSGPREVWAEHGPVRQLLRSALPVLAKMPVEERQRAEELLRPLAEESSLDAARTNAALDSAVFVLGR